MSDSPKAAAAAAAAIPSQHPWTDAQLRGIRTTGHSLLVSAAAGSGKTAMLAARCAYLVCDAPDPCNVDALLVVTFTEAAAAQMKSRIQAALRERAGRSNSQRLRRQAAMADQANVGTLHGFCARLLREHFHVAGLDPAFTVLDGQEAALLRRDVARTLFDDRYELDESGDFQRFVDAYGEGDDARLVRRVVHVYEMLGSLVDPDAWLARARSRIAQGADGSIEAGELGAELRALLASGLNDVRRRCADAIRLVREAGEFPRYLEALGECEQVLRFWDETLAQHGIDALAEEVRSLQMPRLPAVSNAIPGKARAKAAVDGVRDAMRDGPWRDLLRFTAAEWQAGMAAIRPHADVFLKLVEDFGLRYRQAKDASRAVDFNDLERLALRALTDEAHPVAALVPSRVARGYHQRFAHLMVDEYQDINEVQDAILTLLSRPWDTGEPGRPASPANLFCVGDVKQSIYRFRLAEAARFLARQRAFLVEERAANDTRLGEVIDLQSNFRSRGPLLEAINGVFERLMTSEAVDIEYDRTHYLQAGLRYPEATAGCFDGAPIEVHLLPQDLGDGHTGADDDPDCDPPPDRSAADEPDLDRTEREAILVAQRLRRIMGLDGSAPACVMDKDGAGGLAPRPVRFGDIAILLRSTQHKSGQYADALRRAGIPVHAQAGTGFFKAMEVRDVLSLLAVLDNQRQDIPLAAVLRSPILGLPEPESAMAAVRSAYPAQGDGAVPFCEAVVRYAQEKDDVLAGRLRSALATLDEWRARAHGRPLAELLWTIYQHSGYLAFCSGLHDGEQRVANLLDLHARAAQFGTFQRQGLSRFLQFLDGLQDEADLGQAAVSTEADDAVRVMSIHRSKGLEFPVVVLPDLGKRINLADCQGTILADRSAGLGLAVVDDERMIRYPSLASALVQRRLRQQALAEELRVLYVAMTRAREHLILVGTCSDKDAERWSAWAGRAGAFPADLVLGARCMLDWLGPVAAASGAGERNILHIERHSAEEVRSWTAAQGRRVVLSESQARLAALEPLSPAPADDSAARAVIDRLEHRYAFEHYTRLAAAGAVTQGNATRDNDDDAHDHGSRDLPLPKFMGEQSASAADRGTAMHAVLAHLDFRGPCDRSDIAAQIEHLVGRRLLGRAQGDTVDVEAIAWMMSTELGGLLRQHADTIRRELPVHFAAAPPAEQAPASSDPQDRVMIRGRLDVLIPRPAGHILIDYKTDAVAQDDVPRAAAQYAGQLQQYAQAVERITGRPVVQSWIVFLTARHLHAVHPTIRSSTDSRP